MTEQEFLDCMDECRRRRKQVSLIANKVIETSSKNTLGVIITKRNNKKFVIFIDKEDYKRIRMFRWNMGNNGYAVSSTIGANNPILMHRLIMSFPLSGVVDHINKDKLDNRKCNLRNCSWSQNSHNRDIRSTNKYSGIKINKNGKFRYSIKVDGKDIYTKSFLKKEDALLARKKLAKELLGEFSNY